MGMGRGLVTYDEKTDRATIRPIRGVRGTVYVPGDKSISHRAAILGSIALGITEVRGFLLACDTMRTIECLRALGVKIEVGESHDLVIYGRGLKGLIKPTKPLDVGNSGTTMRLLAGVLAGYDFATTLTGDASIRRRPMDRIAVPLRLMGATVSGRGERCFPPIIVRGGKLRSIEYRMPIASAQVKSCILLAGLYAPGFTVVIEPAPSRDHTERMLGLFGAEVYKSGLRVAVRGPSELRATTLRVPGDFSSAAFLIAAALLAEEGELTIRDVGVNPTRTGFLDIVREMGGQVELRNEREVSGEPVADIVARPSRLRGVTVKGEVVPRAIDELPLVAVLGCFAEGETRIEGASELRVKECDRIAALSSELPKLGAEVEELEDGLVVRGGRPIRGGQVKSYGDHRMAMALTVAALRGLSETRVEEAGCVRISFPGFFEALDSLVYA